MDQQAKKHLQEEFDAALEEKDQMITVLQTQVRSHTYVCWAEKHHMLINYATRSLAYRDCVTLQ